MPTFVSYYTRGDVYEMYAERLRRSLRGYACRIEAIDRKPGGWQPNVHYKAELLLDVMKRTKRPVVWIDADCILKNHTLVVLNKEFIAYRPQPFFIAGTVLKLDYNGLAMRFLELWAEYLANPAYAYVWDDALMTLAYVNAQVRHGRAFDAVFADRTARLGVEHANASKLHNFRTPGEITVYDTSVLFRQAVVARDYSREWTVQEAFAK